MYQRLSDLIDHLIEEGALRTPRIIEAFRRVDRADFVLPEYASHAYADTALPIGHGQTISQPYTVALMLELLAPHEGERILDVGSGSGWTTALLAEIVGPEGAVYGVELVPELVAFGQENIAAYGFANASITQATDVLGLPAHAPYDNILVSAADTHVPEQLVAQLKEGGTMVLPVGSAIVRVYKTPEGAVEEERHEGFAFVPLLHD